MFIGVHSWLEMSGVPIVVMEKSVFPGPIKWSNLAMTHRFFFLVAISLALTSCSSVDVPLYVQPPKSDAVAVVSSANWDMLRILPIGPTMSVWIHGVDGLATRRSPNSGYQSIRLLPGQHVIELEATYIIANQTMISVTQMPIQVQAMHSYKLKAKMLPGRGLAEFSFYEETSQGKRLIQSQTAPIY